ncbi:MAG: PAS domain S-box protein [Nitrospiraceae bacterium]|nr:PAS domain S-box protein [Nitrospiraceae bacterium]
MTIAVFLLDHSLPLGYSIWLLYLVPIAYAFSVRMNILYLTAAATLLITIEFFIARPGVSPSVSLANRSLGIILLWIFSYIVMKRRHAEERSMMARKESEELRNRLASIVETSDEAIIGKSLDGVIQTWNTGAEEMYGYSAGEAVGRPVSILVPPGYPNEIPKILERIAKGEHIGHYETVRMRKDGERIFVSISISPVKDENGRIAGAATIAHDITERKRLEESLRNTLSELDRSNKELEQFAYVASHDLQEPLRMVSSYVQLLARKYSEKLDGKALEYIDFAVDGADRMKKLIEGLLAYSRVSRGTGPGKVNTADIFDGAVSNLRASIEENQAAVIKEGPLPEVYGDGTQLLQLFQNLIGNAIKFRRPDVPPVVRVSAGRKGQDWVFAIKDNGIGIDPKYYDRVFLIFQRLHSRQEYPGTGIGLALCKRIVESHGGRIWIESGQGSGSAFFFTIPAQEEPDEYGNGRGYRHSARGG